MKILILNWRDTGHPKSGGAEYVTRKHAEGWIERGHEVTWFTSGYAGAVGDEVRDGVRYIRRGSSYTVFVPAAWHLLTSGKQYDIIIDEIHGIPFFSPIFTKIPVIAFIHEVAGEIWDYMYPPVIRTMGKVLERLYFRVYRNARFWTDAPSTIDELVSNGIPREHCVAIPCPIDTVPISSTDKEEQPTFIFVSRVVKMKGIEEVIKAFAFIRKELTDAQLWIVGGGEGNYIAKLERMLEEYGVAAATRFLGRVSEKKKYQLLARAHLLLHASVKEGWGLVVLEAASQGTPAVVYGVHGLRDVVRDGKTGVVLKTNTPKQLAGEAIRLYADRIRYLQYRKEGMIWTGSLTWDDAVKVSHALLQDVVYGKGRR